MGSEARGISEVLWSTKEIGDFLDCAIKNMDHGGDVGAHRRFMGAGLHRKFAHVANNWGAIDPKGFALCMASEAAKDAAIAKANQIANKALVRNPFYKRPVGQGFGSFSRRMR